VSTPLRSVGGRGEDRSRSGVDFLDGSEDRLLEIMTEADDLSSLSDELHLAATVWPERYHLDRSRGNIMRAMSLSKAHVALEVGAGCGAVTRILGERCAVVDAIEPVRARGRVASERTRDLENVSVFFGRIEDVPNTEAYDVIVVVGVLEYVGHGTADATPYVRFLSELAKRLRAGGTIVCAIENRLGVKYLAGSPEDHTARVFDGLEGYPRGGPARTFSRQELAGLFASAGLQSTFLHAFPDYKLPRVVMADKLFELPGEQIQLAWRLPRFPSPDWVLPRPRLANEGGLWRTFVEAGLGPQVANSFVVLASKEGKSDLWPDERVAVYFNTQRRADFATETRIRRTPSGLRFERTRLAGSERRVERPPLVLQVSDEDFVPGTDLIEVLAEADEAEIRRFLRRWREILTDEQLRDGRDVLSAELAPHNMILRPDGEIELIDQEWWLLDASPRDILERGTLWLAIFLAERRPPDRLPADRVDKLARILGTWVGLEASWLERAIDREAALQAQVCECDPDDRSELWRTAVRAARQRLQQVVDLQVTALPLGEREHDLRAGLEVALADKEGMLSGVKSELASGRVRIRELEELVAERDRRLAELGRAEDLLRRELTGIKSSTGYQLLERFRGLRASLAPRGSRRATVYRALMAPIKRLVGRRSDF
jgi:SAM-dependent methyltransferase